MEKTIVEFLNDYIGKCENGGLVSFHMPGHKGRAGLYERTGYGDFIRNMVTCDITEIPGADALYCPENTIRAVMDNYAELYGVSHTELLVNGSSAGVMAAIIGSVPVGGKLILARNSHHSAFSALRLGGINPVYVHPKTDPRTGLVGEVMPADLAAVCAAEPDADAVLITSPNYYGMLSDISALASVAHEHGMILIVDQAHGAHLNFFDKDAAALISDGAHVPFPRHSAEALGADIVINSTHKTLLSFTGSGILNICSDAVNTAAVSDALRMLQTTSPSYLLMASLDINEKIMRKHSDALIERWRTNLTTFYRRALRIPGISIAGLRPEDAVMLSRKPSTGISASGTDTASGFKTDISNRQYISTNVSGHAGLYTTSASDSTKATTVLSQSSGSDSAGSGSAGIASTGSTSTGSDHTEPGMCNFPMYFNRSGLDMTKINISLATLGISGPALERELRHRGIISEMVHGDYVMLMTGIGNVSTDYSRLLDALWELADENSIVSSNTADATKKSRHQAETEFDLDVTDVPYDYELVPLYSADDRVLYDPVIVYPPGTPIACPGEILTVEVIKYISDAIARGEKVVGVDDEGMVRVGIGY